MIHLENRVLTINAPPRTVEVLDFWPLTKIAAPLGKKALTHLSQKVLANYKYSFICIYKYI
tara:strand:- start:378 stop:560 length:183 start_codon:yes stop_codon:yes gene_type:complete